MPPLAHYVSDPIFPAGVKCAEECQILNYSDTNNVQDSHHTFDFPVLQLTINIRREGATSTPELLEELVGAPLPVVERVAVEPLAARQHRREAQLELADVARVVARQEDVHHDVPPHRRRRSVVPVLDADN